MTCRFRNPWVQRLGLTILLAHLCTAGIANVSARNATTSEQVRQYLEQHPAHLLDNPEIIEKTIALAQNREREAKSEELRKLISKNSDLIQAPEYSPVSGNPDGPLTIVEFSDYQCGPCKASYKELEVLLKSNKDVRVIHKFLPIYGVYSNMAAKAAIAAHQKSEFAPFHRALMGNKEPWSYQAILELAESAAIDAEYLKANMQKPEFTSHIKRTRELAEKLGISGTPAYLVGDQLMRGRITALQLAKIINDKNEIIPGADTNIIGGKFELLNHNKQLVSEKDFFGKYLLVSFGFTNCPDICPMSMTKISNVMNLIEDSEKHIQPILVTVDPKRDTSEKLAQYVKYFHPSIVGLSGSIEQIENAKKQFLVYSERHALKEFPDSYTVSHTSNIYFMDRQGRFIDHFKLGTREEEMAEAIRSHL